MDKAAFADTDADPKWWLLQPEIADTLIELRRDIGEHAGWSREQLWYEERWRLEDVYDLIERSNGYLLQELDEATDDYRRQDWITKVIEAIKPKAVAEDHELATPAPGADALEPVAAEAPKPKGSIFKRKDNEKAKPDPQMEAAVQHALTHLEPEKLPGLADELGVTAEELAELIKDLPADFEKLVAAEVARMSAGANQ